MSTLEKKNHFCNSNCSDLFTLCKLKTQKTYQKLRDKYLLRVIVQLHLIFKTLQSGNFLISITSEIIKQSKSNYQIHLAGKGHKTAKVSSIR